MYRMFVFIVCLAAFVAPASAQTKLPIPLNLPIDPLGLNTKNPNDPLKQIVALIQKIEDKGTADLEAADALANTANPDTGTIIDPIAHACYPALIKWIGTLPKASNTAGQGIITLYEEARIARMLIQAGFPVYVKLGCGALVQDERQQLLQFVGKLFGVTLVGVTLP